MAENDNLIPVNILIADRSYRLKIEPEDEEMVRRTMKMINEKIVEYRMEFSGKDMQDYVAMVLLWFATELQKPSTTAPVNNSEAINKLQRLEELITKSLEN
ncbi:cell division protein ZapA [Aridibaculum aurantiacum]|uniref:cell division protein ZapA n=1 Tax=Aridibaculum aurantiacum TaxID=2810307 RepID=UPI001A95C593|nr:cell division protein ZapA [Aridibaculum aurantiacum]